MATGKAQAGSKQQNDGATPEAPASEVASLTPAKNEVRLQAPEDCTSISIRGVLFEVPESGLVDAPPDVADELRSHGFTDAKKASKRASLEG
jgi:hypothetical protein